MSEHKPHQLALGVSLKEATTFSNFIDTSGLNAEAIHALESSAHTIMPLFLWGERGCGLSHLLQAVCHGASGKNRTAVYLPLLDLKGMDAQAILEGMEQQSIVCLDDVDKIEANPEWEEAIFHLFNKLKDAGHSLIVASHSSPATLSIDLPDLRSRLLSGVAFHIASLTDDGKVRAMVERSSERGMEMPEDVAKFILSRAPRDPQFLFSLLNLLDDASLQAQRKLTIPFVKDVIERQ